MIDSSQMMSNFKFISEYSRWLPDLDRYETWEEAVDRVMDMHRKKHAAKLTPELEELLGEATTSYKDKRVLGSQRGLQFGGPSILKHETRLYNCTSTYIDRLRAFSESMYQLLSGAGVGFSVQKEHIARLPPRIARTTKVLEYLIPDSIEGWSDSYAVLLSSFASKEDAIFPEYSGKKVYFNFSAIRPKGAFISGNFKAPGSTGLKNSLSNVERLLEEAGPGAYSPILAYDILMHMSNAVLSGGLRRSATIALFSQDDEEMLRAKTGNWFITNPQRARSNNSAILIRDQLTLKSFREIIESVKAFGEPGFIFADSTEYLTNPCAEIGMYARTTDENPESGFSACNLVEINGGMVKTKEDFYLACRAGAILGTLQAGFTNFKYLTDATRRIIEREALLGVSITGFANSPDILFDPEVLREGARVCVEMNERVAELLGINSAARVTCVKPSGNASVLLRTASGVHAEHSARYIRNVTKNETEEVIQLLASKNPNMVEKSLTSDTDMTISFPIVTPEGSIFKRDLLGVKQLKLVKLVQENWVIPGKNSRVEQKDFLQHNVSNTITVDDWDEVADYIYSNREFFTGVSLLSASGDLAYPQSPFTAVLTEQELLDNYGTASIFASGIIVDALACFNDNLWNALNTTKGYGEDLTEGGHENLLKRDWVRRATKFADNYFEGDLERMSECLKHVYNLHKWHKVTSNLKVVDFTTELGPKGFVSVDTLAGQSCSGNQCEITF